jgi:hypothetical protein
MHHKRRWLIHYLFLALDCDMPIAESVWHNLS